MSKREVVNIIAAELNKRPAEDRRVPATAEDRAKVACWCGAKANKPCLTADGTLQGFQHGSRGMRRKVVVELAKLAGLPWPR